MSQLGFVPYACARFPWCRGCLVQPELLPGKCCLVPLCHIASSSCPSNIHSCSMHVLDEQLSWAELKVELLAALLHWVQRGAHVKLMGSGNQVLRLELIEHGWLPPLSPKQTPPPTCTKLQWTMPLLFWERALKSADEKGWDYSINTDKTKVGIFKMSLDKGVILAEQEFPAMKNLCTNPLSHKIWVKTKTFEWSKADSFLKPHFYLNNDEKITTQLFFHWCLGHHSHSLKKKLNYAFTLEDSFTPFNRAGAALWSAACSSQSAPLSLRGSEESQFSFLDCNCLSLSQLCTPALKGSTKLPARIYMTHFPARALNSLQFYPTSLS